MYTSSEIKLDSQQLAAYFRRIGLDITKMNLTPNFDLLATLHEHHVFSIPFENLSIFLEQEIKLDLESVFDKLVTQERGGYCYEMNLLFYAVLKTLNFRPGLNFAEVIYDGELRSRPARHAILIVFLANNHYLVDVGYGRNGLIKPLLLKNNEQIEAKAYSSQFRVNYEEQYGFIYSSYFKEKYNVEYRFDLFPDEKQNAWQDLETHNQYACKNAHSIFTKMIVITKPSTAGRLTLHNNVLIEFNGETRNQTILNNKEDFLRVLKELFGLQLLDDSKLQLPFKFPHEHRYSEFFNGSPKQLTTGAVAEIQVGEIKIK